MGARLSIGDIQLSLVSGGHLRIDGGNMFGVVPRVGPLNAVKPAKAARARS